MATIPTPTPTPTFTPRTPPVQTVEQIAQHYKAALDSVDLINTLVAKSPKTQDELDSIKRNTQHLEIMVAKTFWTTEDLTPLTAAITLGKSVEPPV